MNKFVFVVFCNKINKYDTIAVYKNEDDAIRNVEDLNNVFPDLLFDYRALDLFFFLDQILMEVVQ